MHIGNQLDTTSAIDYLEYVLPNLQELRLDHTQPVEWRLFLGRLITPALRTLSTWDHANNPQQWSPDPILSLISRSKCDLGTLQIRATGHDKEIPLANMQSGLDVLFRETPLIWTLHADFVIPPEIFRAIQDKKMLQWLKYYHGRLSSRGVHALFDLLLTYPLIPDFNGKQPIRGLNIVEANFIYTPHSDQAYSDVVSRWVLLEDDFEQRGVEVGFLNEEGLYIEY